ncbi:hypothetical protein HK101_003834 [Irineochytrium annulatum]|nr:hypothetical protein HK101_003834 [Irineochytrium annulatum]
MESVEVSTSPLTSTSASPSRQATQSSPLRGSDSPPKPKPHNRHHPHKKIHERSASFGGVNIAGSLAADARGVLRFDESADHAGRSKGAAWSDSPEALVQPAGPQASPRVESRRSAGSNLSSSTPRSSARMTSVRGAHKSLRTHRNRHAGGETVHNAQHAPQGSVGGGLHQHIVAPLELHTLNSVSDIQHELEFRAAETLNLINAFEEVLLMNTGDASMVYS